MVAGNFDLAHWLSFASCAVLCSACVSSPVCNSVRMALSTVCCVSLMGLSECESVAWCICVREWALCVVYAYLCELFLRLCFCQALYRNFLLPETVV